MWRAKFASIMIRGGHEYYCPNTAGVNILLLSRMLCYSILVIASVKGSGSKHVHCSFKPVSFLDPLSRSMNIGSGNVSCCLYINRDNNINNNWTKRDLKKLNKNESLLNRYNFSTVNATNFLFSPLHTTPLLYRKTYFGLLNYLLAIVAWSDTQRGSKPPYL